MHAVVNAFRWVDLEDREPDASRDDAHELLEIYVGTDIGHGQDRFQVEVVTPKALARCLEERPIMLGVHYLIVREFNPSAVERHLKSVIESIEASTWEGVANIVDRIAEWEFGPDLAELS
ncbi:Imm8 family immunity protein [Nonomuraea sp. NPDC049400]|uniref:Imm8 family immunity protein n=1 Tax=Nonomuraea sp. NPDC049400 TaxID=3364352 RepID=UPI0037BABE91